MAEAVAGADAGTCGGCRAPLAPGARFCTACGRPVGARPAGERPATARPEPQPADGPRLVECATCGAGNAASRPLCARCGTPMRAEVPGGDALPPMAGGGPSAGGPPAAGALSGAGRRSRDEPPVLLALVVLAGLITAGVLLALVTERVRTPGAEAVPVGVALRDAEASSAAAGAPARLVVDGDPTTAWSPGTDGEDPPWIEVALAEPVDVLRLVVWNGDQADELAAAEAGWASVVRIEVGDRQFRVRLEDVLGPQLVDLPEPVRADRVRLVVEQARPGAARAAPAISELVVDG